MAEFAKDGKIVSPFSGQMISRWIIYGVVAVALAAMAIMEHRGYRRIAN